MSLESTNKYFGGLSGLVLDIPKYLFPPPFQDASRLTYYASLFNSIEINTSFYKLPRSVTVQKWVESVPANFRFTFKLWRQITHNNGFAFEQKDVEDFMRSISPAADKKGCLLIQTPPRMGREGLARLELLLSTIRTCDAGQWPIAVEFRNKSWYHEQVYLLLEKYHSGLVIHDIPKSSTPLIDHEEDFIYLRFHGPKGDYRHSYDDFFLAEYASYIKEWMENNKTVYVYFNNTIGDAFINLKTLNKMLTATI